MSEKLTWLAIKAKNFAGTSVDKYLSCNVAVMVLKKDVMDLYDHIIDKAKETGKPWR